MRALARAAFAGVLLVAFALPATATARGSARRSAHESARRSARATAPAATLLRGYDPAPAWQRFGINGQVMFWMMRGLNWSPLVSEMKSDGIQIVRADAPWQSAQPTAADGNGGIYDWSELDAIATSLANQGLRWLPVIDYSAPWAASEDLANGQPNIDSPPRNDSLYADYAGELVARYGPGGSFWQTHPTLPYLPATAVEIWNEENTPGFWQPAPDATAYLQLYEAARSAVHAVTPSEEVLVGGLSNPSSTFLNAMYAAGGEHRGLFDGVAVHPYGTTPALVLHDLELGRAALDAHGDFDTPLDVTEVGWPSLSKGKTLIGTVLPPKTSTSLPYIPDSLRATYLSSITQSIAASDCGVERILPDTWVTSEQQTSNEEDWYGIVSADGVPTETAGAYAHVIETLEGAAATGHAESNLCGRSLTLVAARSTATQPHVKPGRKRPAARPQACVKATTASDGVRIDHAIVTFSELSPQAGAPAPRMISSAASATGTAVHCFAARARRRVVIEVSAQRPDFSNVPLTRLSIRVP